MAKLGYRSASKMRMRLYSVGPGQRYVGSGLSVWSVSDSGAPA
jgi:hypothetical protein